MTSLPVFGYPDIRRAHGLLHLVHRSFSIRSDRIISETRLLVIFMASARPWVSGNPSTVLLSWFSGSCMTFSPPLVVWRRLCSVGTLWGCIALLFHVLRSFFVLTVLLCCWFRARKGDRAFCCEVLRGTDGKLTSRSSYQASFFAFSSVPVPVSSGAVRLIVLSESLASGSMIRSLRGEIVFFLLAFQQSHRSSPSSLADLLSSTVAVSGEPSGAIFINRPLAMSVISLLRRNVFRASVTNKCINICFFYFSLFPLLIWIFVFP